MVRYEIHVNARSMREDTESELLGIGFSPDPFLPSGLDHTPTNHFTWESYDNPRLRDEKWDGTLSLVKGDDTFQGYAESETVSKKYIVKFDNSDVYHHFSEFPIEGLRVVQLPEGVYKSSDIHVKRSLDLNGDKLESLLLDHGFYRVCTPRNRILTLHTEWVRDAKNIFDKLKNYFSRSGGVKGMELEVVSGFYRSHNFPLANAVPRG